MTTIAADRHARLDPDARATRADESAVLARARDAMAHAADALWAKRRTEGETWGGAQRGPDHWCAELEGDSILSSEYLLMKWILGQETDRPEADPDRFARICNHMRLTQRDDGSWGQYPEGAPDISACVKAYFCLKLFGDHPDAPHMTRAREAIRALGGAERINTFSTFYLACLGQVSWDACPVIPPEIALLPRWSPFHMDKVAAWTRTMILPLAICSALRPVRTVPPELGIDELFLDPRARTRLNQAFDRDEPIGWTNTFLVIDRALKIAQKAGWARSSLRAKALRESERWILERMRPDTTEGLGAIFPPMVYVQIAFKALGYRRTHPVIVEAERQLDAFIIDEPSDDPRLDHVRLQPCFSPVWDTGIALYALTEAGARASDDERVARVCDWLLDKRVTLTGDWIRNLDPADRAIRLDDSAEDAGAAWAFEYRNDWYPDNDDTAKVAMALHRAGDRPGQTRNRDAARRAMRWLMAMQNEDGGWAAFDRTKDRAWMEAVPFADHNAMQDPSCPDITGRIVESMRICGVPASHPAIERALRYILAQQDHSGAWIGRWGVNWLYGTWQALGGLAHAGGHPRNDDSVALAMRRAEAWVRSVQNDDGGFGETADSYIDPALKGRGESTASQTSWGLMCLLFCADPADPAVERAVEWLCAHQLAHDKAPFEPARSRGFASGGDAVTARTDTHAPIDWVRDRAGAWAEHLFTGTGFPKVFYLRYHLYRHSFPLAALARYVALRTGRA